MFRPQYCDGATVIWSPFLVSVPRDSYNGTPVPCGGCRADVLEDIDARTPEARGLHFAGIAQRVPERCRSCGILLEPRGLIAEMRNGITGELVSETAPFGRFVIALDPAPKAHPPVYPHGLDPQLLGELKGCAGVPFRHAGRWS